MFNNNTENSATGRRQVLKTLGLTFGSLVVASFLTGCDSSNGDVPPFSSLKSGELKDGLSLTDKQRKLIALTDYSSKLENSFNGIRTFVDEYASGGQAVLNDFKTVQRQRSLLETTKTVLIKMQEDEATKELGNQLSGLYSVLTDFDSALRDTKILVEKSDDTKFSGIDAALDSEERLELLVKILKADSLALEQAKEIKPESANSSHSTVFVPYFPYYAGYHGEGYGYSRNYNYGSQSDLIKSRFSSSSRLSVGRSGTSRISSGARTSGGFGGRGVSAGT